MLEDTTDRNDKQLIAKPVTQEIEKQFIMI